MKAREVIVKIVKVVFYIVSYGGIAYGGLTALLVANPDLQAWLNIDVNAINTTLLGVSGVGFGILGSIGIIIMEYMNKQARKGEKLYLDMASKFITIKDKYDEVKVELTKTTNEIVKVKQDIIEYHNVEIEQINQLIELVKVDLQAKLSNPLIEQKVKELIIAKVGTENVSINE